MKVMRVNIPLLVLVVLCAVLSTARADHISFPILFSLPTPANTASIVTFQNQSDFSVGLLPAAGACRQFQYTLTESYTASEAITAQLSFYTSANEPSDTWNMLAYTLCISTGDTYVPNVLLSGTLNSTQVFGQGIRVLYQTSNLIDPTGCQPGDEIVIQLCREVGGTLAGDISLIRFNIQY